jgi:hypothetical protein
MYSAYQSVQFGSAVPMRFAAVRAEHEDLVTSAPDHRLKVLGIPRAVDLDL